MYYFERPYEPFIRGDFGKAFRTLADIFSNTFGPKFIFSNIFGQTIIPYILSVINIFSIIHRPIFFKTALECKWPKLILYNTKKIDFS